MNDGPFENRLREQLTDLAAHAQTTPDRPLDEQQPSGGHRGRRALIAALVAVVLGVAAAIVATRDNSSPSTVATEATAPSTEVQTTATPSTTDDPSQSAADAARDGVPAAIAELSLADRIEAQAEELAEEGRWVLSRMPNETARRFPDGIPDPDGYLGANSASAFEYGEVVLLADGEVVKAYPMQAAPPSWVLVTDATAYVGTIGDGGLPFSVLMRIDRATLAAEVVTIPPPSENYDATWPPSWHEATRLHWRTYDTLVGFKPEGMTGTPATSWVGEVVVNVAGIDAFINEVITQRPEGCNYAPSGTSSTDYTGNGTYAVLIESFDIEELEVSFDVVQWLTGQDAIDDYHLEYPDDPTGPPNDYRIRNDNPQIRSAPVAADAPVGLVRLSEDSSADINEGTLDELPTYLSGGGSSSLWWLTFDDGTITDLCEQYVP